MHRFLSPTLALLWCGLSATPLCGQDASNPEQLPEDVLDELTEMTASCRLVTPGQEPPLVVIGNNATEAEQYAARELAEHLLKITGREIPVLKEGEELPKDRKIIAIGESGLTKNHDIAALGEEQYLIDIQPEIVVIAGGRKPPIVAPDGKVHVRERGTLYGVYDFLERLGVRWYRPEPWGWHIPKMDTIDLKVARTVSQPPAFTGRQAVFTTCRWDGQQPADLREAMVWSVRQRTNVKTSPDPKYGGVVDIGIDHAHSRIIPPAKYLKNHPEYFALVNGERGNPGSGRTPQLCLGNPELQEVFARKVIEAARAKPQALSISVDPDDGTQKDRRMCACPLCLAMDDPDEPELMSNRVFGFTNIVARKVAQEVPEARLGLYAYSMHTRPPTLFRQLEPNVIVAVANINSWTDWSKEVTDPKSWQNARYLALVKEWQQVTTNPLWMREYSAYGWAGPIPMYRLLQERIRTYRDIGIAGFDWSNRPNRGPQMLLLYFKAQLQWNPDLDMDRELDLFYTHYFGPAAEPMKRYFERSMAALEAFGVGTSQYRTTINSGGRGMHLFYTPKLVEELGGYLKDAQERINHEPLYTRRLAGVLAGHEFCRRVSEIVTLKLSDGEPRPNPVVATGIYLDSERARQAWGDLQKWVVDTHKGDLVFALQTKDGVPTTPEFSYMAGDMLKNRRYPAKDERRLLIEHGFAKDAPEGKQAPVH